MTSSGCINPNTSAYCDGCRGANTRDGCRNKTVDDATYNNALQAAVLAVSKGAKNWVNDPTPQGLDGLRAAIEDEILKLRK